MSYANYPYHHDASVCTIVHYADDHIAEDYCLVCHAVYMCAGVQSSIAASHRRSWATTPAPTPATRAARWAAATGSCPHPVTLVAERDARDETKQVPAGHLSGQRSACVIEHYQVPGSTPTGEFWHDSTIVYDRCTGCGSTFDCPTVRSSANSCPWTPPTEETR